MKGSPQEITIEFLKEIRVDKMLDIGCGNGNIGYIIKDKGIAKYVFGIDTDAGLLCDAEGKGVVTHNADLSLQKLPFSDDFFDAITCIDVVEHILDVESLFIEIRRVLKPEGLLVISTPNIQFIYHILRLVFGYGPNTSFGDANYFGSDLLDGGHIHYFTEKDLMAIFKKHKYEILKTKGTYNVRNNLIAKFMKISSDISLSKIFNPGIVIKAIKKV